MLFRLILLALLGLGTASLAAEPLVLQAVTSTSGPGAELLFDGKPATGWRPEGSPVHEGVLLRLESPVALDGVTLSACPGTSSFSVELFLDGALVLEALVTDKPGAPLTFARARPRSLFVRVITGGVDDVCLGELGLVQQGAPVALAAPRWVPGRVTASTTLAPEEAYHPGLLFDDRLDFGWAEGDAGPGTGQSFTLTLEAPVELVALELWNGHQRSEEHFKKNARAKSLAVSVDGGPAVTLPVKDVSGRQRLTLPQPLKGRAWTVRVEDVYPSTSYPDLVLGELRLVDAKGSLGVHTPDADTRRQAVRARLAGSPLDRVVDRHWVAVCSLEKDNPTVRSLKLRTRGTFVFYSETMDHDAIERLEVVEGAWVLKKAEGPWASVDLFGRRSLHGRDWAPYADRPSTQGPVRNAGGLLEVARVESLSLPEYQKLMSSWTKGVQGAAVNCVGADEKSYRDLIQRQAAFVRGKAFTDLLEPQGDLPPPHSTPSTAKP